MAWNGTAESAAAVQAAMPWLQRAEAVRVLYADEYQRRGPGAKDLAELSGAARRAGRNGAVPAAGPKDVGARAAGGGAGVRRRSAGDGRLFALAAAAIDPRRRDPARAGVRCDPGDDELLNAGGRPAWRRPSGPYVKLNRAARSVLAAVEPQVAASGLTLTQLGVLEAVLHKGPMTQRELGRKVLTSAGNMTDVVDKLAARGLIRRERRDGRSVSVELTEEGRSLIEGVFPSRCGY